MEVSDLVLSLSTLLFPGFYEETTTSSSNITGNIVAQCSHIQKCLTNLVHKSLKHDCKEGFNCIRSEGDCWNDAVEISTTFLKKFRT